MRLQYPKLLIAQAMWDCDETIPDAPEWCKDMCFREAAGLAQTTTFAKENFGEGGASGGCYMACMEYDTALEVMKNFGDEILDFLKAAKVYQRPPMSESWAGMAVWYYSHACEIFARGVVGKWSAGGYDVA